MTRKEEILAEAYKFAKKAYITVGTLPKSTLVAIGCDMAEWADSHPRKGLVDIEKVCDWLKENSTYYPYYIPDAKENKTIRVNIWDGLCKAMEE